VMMGKKDKYRLDLSAFTSRISNRTQCQEFWQKNSTLHFIFI